MNMYRAYASVRRKGLSLSSSVCILATACCSCSSYVLLSLMSHHRRFSRTLGIPGFPPLCICSFVQTAFLWPGFYFLWSTYLLWASRVQSLFGLLRLAKEDGSAGSRQAHSSREATCWLVFSCSFLTSHQEQPSPYAQYGASTIGCGTMFNSLV